MRERAEAGEGEEGYLRRAHALALDDQLAHLKGDLGVVDDEGSLTCMGSNEKQWLAIGATRHMHPSGPAQPSSAHPIPPHPEEVCAQLSQHMHGGMTAHEGGRGRGRGEG